MGRTIKEVFIHCSATKPDWMKDAPADAKRDEIASWHTRDRGWRAIGYDKVIDRDGTVVIGRDLDRDGVAYEDVGAHAKGFNTHSVSICLIGGHGSSATDDFYDNFTPAQNAALRAELDAVKVQFGDLHVRGHNEVAAKACPGFTVSTWHAYRAPRANPAQSTSVQAGSGITVAGCTAAVGAVSGALDGLDPTAQYILLGGAVLVALLGLWVVKERLRKWAAGDR